MYRLYVKIILLKVSKLEEKFEIWMILLEASSLSLTSWFFAPGKCSIAVLALLVGNVAYLGKQYFESNLLFTCIKYIDTSTAQSDKSLRESIDLKVKIYCPKEKQTSSDRSTHRHCGPSPVISAFNREEERKEGKSGFVLLLVVYLNYCVDICAVWLSSRRVNVSSVLALALECPLKNPSLVLAFGGCYFAPVTSQTLSL
ncbi:hypothetical protein FCM35_KLT11617 [Carex littledalei]|uniref:Uncharacterized protein n=1 Tax=Carex littledalei TaxID=544730 RepID=A0A833VFI3_9POAL|nr:hypothetical protein FCM35_KLT11617 [Carex littledalei]